MNGHMYIQQRSTQHILNEEITPAVFKHKTTVPQFTAAVK